MMPERDKAVLHVASIITDAKVFDGLMGGTPRGMRRKQWEGLQAIIDFLFMEIIEKVDWNRVLLTATTRHARMVELDPDHFTDRSMLGGWKADGGGREDDGICPDCIIEALLSESTMGPKDDGTPTERHPLWRKEWLEEAGGAEGLLKSLAPTILRAAANGRLESTAEQYEADDA